jgi:cell division septum initiation protein DivIVA
MVQKTMDETYTQDPAQVWNLATLDMYFTKVMDERDRTYQQRWEASEKATVTALNAAKEAVAAALQAQKDAVSTAFTAQEKAVAAALTAADRAVSKAEFASEKRFDSVNEFRAQLSDQAASFVPRGEFNRALEALTERVDATNKVTEARMIDLRTAADGSARQLTEKMESNHASLEGRIEATARQLTEKMESNHASLEGRIEGTNKASVERHDRVMAALNEKMESMHASFGERLDDLRTYRDTTVGKTSGVASGWTVLVGMIGLVATVLVIVMQFVKR